MMKSYTGESRLSSFFCWISKWILSKIKNHTRGPTYNGASRCWFKQNKKLWCGKHCDTIPLSCTVDHAGIAEIISRDSPNTSWLSSKGKVLVAVRLIVCSLFCSALKGKVQGKLK